MNFLNYDSPFMTEFRKLVDFIMLGMLWMLASIPLFTYGAATTAMFYTGEKSIRRDEGKIWATFWKCFKREFKQATVLWLISFVLTAMLAVNCLVLWRVQLHSVIFALLLVAVLFGVCWMQLWFGYLSKFEDTTRVLLSNSFRITLINVPRVVLLLLLNIVAVVVAVISFFYAPPVLFLIPGIYGILAGIVFRKIFRNYLPEEPAPEEELTKDEAVAE